MEKLKIYAKTIDDETLRQIREMSDSEAYRECLVRIMPDCHAGKSCTVGTVIKTEGRVVPNTVGVDIGCGMLVAEFKHADIDLKRLDEVVGTLIPSGQDIHAKPIAAFEPLSRLRCLPDIDLDKALCAIGSLGGGNHFIEADKDDDGTTYLVIHSGSRNLGVKVCKHYQRRAVKCAKDISEQSRPIIEQMKREGRQKEISKVLAEIQRPVVQEEMAYVKDEALDDYLHDMQIAQLYAKKNRETMLNIICRAMGLTPDNMFHTIHNYIEQSGSEVTLRKGAVSAKEGELLIIPMNMRDGSLICRGKGNSDWLCSAPHGAGRLMSRSEAREKLSLQEFEASMQGIYTTSVCAETIDESPMSYKPMQEIVDCIEPTVDILKIIKPIYNFKAKG